VIREEDMRSVAGSSVLDRAICGTYFGESERNGRIQERKFVATVIQKEMAARY
jgi:hypothetical protein